MSSTLGGESESLSLSLSLVPYSCMHTHTLILSQINQSQKKKRVKALKLSKQNGKPILIGMQKLPKDFKIPQ